MKIKFFLAFLLAFIPGLVLAQGFDENYEVRKGDINGDGLTDLYIRQEPQIVILHGDIATPIVMPAPVSDFVLRQEAEGKFSIVSNLSTSQRSQALQWSNANIELVVNDFNIDDAADLLIKGINSSIPGALDQFVFSSDQKGNAPVSVTAVDDQFKKFFKEANGWALDRDYFEKTAIENGWYSYEGEEKTGWWYISYINVYYSYGDGKRFLDENDDPEDINNKPAYCEDFPSNCAFNSAVGTWWVYGTFIEEIEIVFDYKNFHQDALAFAEVITNISTGDATDLGSL